MRSLFEEKEFCLQGSTTVYENKQKTKGFLDTKGKMSKDFVPPHSFSFLQAHKALRGQSQGDRFPSVLNGTSSLASVTVSPCW